MGHIYIDAKFEDNESKKDRRIQAQISQCKEVEAQAGSVVIEVNERQIPATIVSCLALNLSLAPKPWD